MSLPEIIAHRGASHAAPENTLSAVRLAQAEGDRSLSKDQPINKSAFFKWVVGTAV